MNLKMWSWSEPDCSKIGIESKSHKEKNRWIWTHTHTRKFSFLCWNIAMQVFFFNFLMYLTHNSRVPLYKKTLHQQQNMNMWLVHRKRNVTYKHVRTMFNTRYILINFFLLFIIFSQPLNISIYCWRSLMACYNFII